MNGRWMAAVLLAGALALTGGCASLEELNQAKAAANRAAEELEKANASLQMVRAENRQLQDAIKARDLALANKDEIIKVLEAAKAALDGDYAALKTKYDELAAKGTQVVMGGPNIALPPEMDKELRALAEQYKDLLEYLPEYGMVKLKADMTFAPGSTDLKPEAVAALKKLGGIMNGEVARKFNIYCAGHTDDIPITKQETLDKHGSNWGLSAHRALAVVESLFKDGKMDQERMAGMGFSKYHPVAPNAAGNKGNPQNRRVELWIVPPGKFLTLVKPTAPPT